MCRQVLEQRLDLRQHRSCVAQPEEVIARLLEVAGAGKLGRRRTRRVQAYSRLSGRAIKFAGESARRRDAGWPALPGRIRWIHTYRAEDDLAAVRLPYGDDFVPTPMSSSHGES